MTKMTTLNLINNKPCIAIVKIDGCYEYLDCIDKQEAIRVTNLMTFCGHKVIAYTQKI